MKQGIILALAIWALAGGLHAQLCVVEGTVVDALTNEPLIGAYIKSVNSVVATDFDGAFSLALPKGAASLEVSYIGYASQQRQVECTGASTQVRFRMETLIMEEAVVSADVVISRKTPVAFTNVLPAQIQEELAGRDLPLVLNTTPGVYATQQGGGDGDARVTIRGFDQTNLAVMVDGVPMNDMENGWVYWSNWAGLDLVVRTTQVQRGLGASKLAIPSVGGTINILTGGDESANGSINYQSEIGSYGYYRNSLSGVFGNHEKGFLHFTGSYKANRGFADGLESETYAYYLKGRTSIGNHNLSLTTFGAPQRHGQRAYQMQVFEYDTNLAQQLTDEAGQEELAEVLSGLTETSIVSRGREFNEFMVNYQEVYYNYNEETGQIDTTYGDVRRYNSRQNFYFKPIVTVRDVWSLSDRSTLTTTAYASFGTGGGEALSSTPGDRTSDGELDMQGTWDSHQLFEFGPNGLNVDENGERKGSNFIRIAHNDHRWFGALSNFSTQLSDQLNFSAGVDVRHYTGSHYRTLGNMFGADYYDAPDDRRDQNASFDAPLREGDKYYYHDDGQVAWGGSYLQLELDKYNYSAFINVSGAQSWYRAIDYFRPNVVTLNDTIYEVRSTDEYRALGETEWKMDTTFVTASHPGLSTYTTDWEQLNSATIKAGGNYNFNEWVNAYMNLGYLNRAPLFNSVFDLNNNVIEGYENQYVKAVEAGVKFAKGKFASNVNAYRTGWENKPVNRFYGVSGLWQDPTLSVYADTSTVAGREFLINLVESDASAEEWGQVAASVIDDVDRSLGYNLLNADAVHSGIEWDFAYTPSPKWDLQGVVSAGNWRWTSNERVELVNSTTNSFITRLTDGGIADTLVNLDGVRVGDAAQRQISGALSFRPKRGTYVSLRNTVFWQHYANFSPGDVITGGAPKDVWMTPAYALLDVNAGTSFDVSDHAKLRLRLSVTNVLDALYVSDATNNSQYAPNPYGVEGGSGRAEVFVGPPRMVRLSAVLELKGLQNKKPKE
ncbi:MAG: TonB-dependent receptor [Bacteroidetes bacterium]|nr:TonB-dependent receptor [Bacteroidota bacterium]MDA0903493.1 TonB-dependent receptor [Bacteroidota bacterium]MDA1241922.1 TonB-dependent receptor [Bacteroidota bacterium]